MLILGQKNIKNINLVDFAIRLLAKKTKSVLYRAKGDEDIGEEFMKSIEKDVKKILKKFDFNKKMDPLTKKEQKDFNKAKICWICQKEFLGEKKLGIIVIFQENFVEQRIINVIFNIEFLLLLQYFFIICRGMTHLFVKNLGVSEGDIQCIPNNDENTSVSAKILLLEDIGKRINGLKKNMKFGLLIVLNLWHLL